MKDKIIAVLEERCFYLFQPGDKEQVVITTRHLASKAGFNKTDEVLIATAASELATNILRYAQKGTMLVRIINTDNHTGIEIIASDQGPGIQNIELALQEHFTTTKKSLGLGLPSVKKIMDEFMIESRPGSGTDIQARKWR